MGLRSAQGSPGALFSELLCHSPLWKGPAWPPLCQGWEQGWGVQPRLGTHGGPAKLLQSRNAVSDLLQAPAMDRAGCCLRLHPSEMMVTVLNWMNLLFREDRLIYTGVLIDFDLAVSIRTGFSKSTAVIPVLEGVWDNKAQAESRGVCTSCLLGGNQKTSGKICLLKYLSFFSWLSNQPRLMWWFCVCRHVWVNPPVTIHQIGQGM